MSANLKIGLIGAGSAVFSLNLVRDLCVTEGLHSSQVWFMDPDEQRLGIVHRLASRYAAELGVDLAFERTTSREQALDGADFVINTALVGAFAAKEVFVAQMGIVFSLGEEASGEGEAAEDEEAAEPLRQRLREAYTPLQGVSIMLFCLLGFPCMATLAVMASESGSAKWMLLQWGGLTVFAYTVCLLVYQVGRLAGLGTR